MDISLHITDWALTQPFRISGHEWINSRCLVVQLQDQGFVGRGEAQGVFYLDETAESIFEQAHAVTDAIRKGVNRQQLQAVFQAGLDAVHGATCVAAHLARNPISLPTSIVAIGKAACAMTSGAQHALGEHLQHGLLITKHGHLTPECQRNTRLTCIEAGHPLPDAHSLEAGTALCEFMDSLPAGDTLLFLISGGASSLVEVLPSGISLELLQRVNHWLLGSGLGITEMNRIRQSLSLIKGGRLLERLRGRSALVLLISDVPGDDPAVIASGPLYPRTAEPSDPELPLPDWLAPLTASARPQPETSDRVAHRSIATIDTALQAATTHATMLGYRATLMDTRLAGDARACGEDIARQLQQQPPGVYLWGGEPLLYRHWDELVSLLEADSRWTSICTNGLASAW